MNWIKTSLRRPAAGSLIVKKWKNGSVWAGVYSGTDKDSSFDEWVALPTDGVAPSQAPSSDAAILGWLNPETGKTCSAAEKHSMEKHQGMPGLHIAKGFRIPLIAAYGVGGRKP